jgi:hypothetical protein
MSQGEFNLNNNLLMKKLEKISDEVALIENLFNDFKLLKTFSVNIKVKKKILKELLEASPVAWRVVGITHNALALFKENDFKKKRGIKIQRAHLIDRDYWYSVLFETEWENSTLWFDFVYENDRTVLALSSENKHIKKIDFIKFQEGNEILFKSTRISWKHGNEEISFLKSLIVA